MFEPSKSEFAYSHQFHPPIPDGIEEGSAIKVRYDGAQISGESVIFAVISSSDLGRLPADITRGLEFSVQDTSGQLRGNPDAFFIGSERDLSLYVNTDAYPDFIDEVREAASTSGLTFLNAVGDLQYMKGPDGDITAPTVPAFIENGMGYVPSLLAMSYLERIRPNHDADTSPELG